MSFEVRNLGGFADAKVIQSQNHTDHRGWFTEEYKKSTFEQLGLEIDIKQINHSMSKKDGTIRGLHYQKNPKPMGKLVSVLQGEAYYVGVDLRKGSPTYKQWESIELSKKDSLQIWFPEGFAVGFCTLKPMTEVIYFVTNEYNEELDSCIDWDDPEIDVNWPVEDPILSKKDKKAPPFKNCNADFEY